MQAGGQELNVFAVCISCKEVGEDIVCGGVQVKEYLVFKKKVFYLKQNKKSQRVFPLLLERLGVGVDIAFTNCIINYVNERRK